MVLVPKSQQLQFHNKLNQKLWIGNKLRPEVRLKLFQGAVAFYKFLNVPRLVVTDITFTGSNAAYNYTPLSDIDVHLIVDFKDTMCPDLSYNFFQTKRLLWADTYDVTIRGHSVELYVEDINEGVTANGIYSILRDEWLKRPSKTIPEIDDVTVDHKVRDWVAKIQAVLDGATDESQIINLLHAVFTLRRNALHDGGEFSTENLAFKLLRNSGYIDKLFDKQNDLKSADLSLD